MHNKYSGQLKICSEHMVMIAHPSQCHCQETHVYINSRKVAYILTHIPSRYFVLLVAAKTDNFRDGVVYKAVQTHSIPLENKCCITTDGTR